MCNSNIVAETSSAAKPFNVKVTQWRQVFTPLLQLWGRSFFKTRPPISIAGGTLNHKASVQ